MKKFIFFFIITKFLFGVIAQSNIIHAIAQPNGEISWPRISVSYNTSTGEIIKSKELRGREYDTGIVGYANKKFYFLYGDKMKVFDPVQQVEEKEITLEKNSGRGLIYDGISKNFLTIYQSNLEIIDINTGKFSKLGNLPNINGFFYS
jgi:hypothetical protein